MYKINNKLLVTCPWWCFALGFGKNRILSGSIQPLLFIVSFLSLYTVGRGGESHKYEHSTYVRTHTDIIIIIIIKIIIAMEWENTNPGSVDNVRSQSLETDPDSGSESDSDVTDYEQVLLATMQDFI